MPKQEAFASLGNLVRVLGHLTSSWLERKLRKQVLENKDGNSKGDRQPGSLTAVPYTGPGNLNRKETPRVSEAGNVYGWNSDIRYSWIQAPTATRSLH